MWWGGESVVTEGSVVEDGARDVDEEGTREACEIGVWLLLPASRPVRPNLVWRDPSPAGCHSPSCLHGTQQSMQASEVGRGSEHSTEGHAWLWDTLAPVRVPSVGGCDSRKVWVRVRPPSACHAPKSVGDPE